MAKKKTAKKSKPEKVQAKREIPKPIEPPKEEDPQKLAKILLENRVSLKDIHKVSGLALDQLSLIKNGKREPLIGTMKKLRDAINEITGKQYTLDDLI